MNRTLKNTLFTLSLIALFNACGSKTAHNKSFTCKLQSQSMAPSWVCEPDIAGGIATVGVEQINPKDSDAQLPQALIHARDAFSRQITTKIKRIFKKFSRKTGLGTDETIRKLVLDISAAIHKDTLPQTTHIAQWTDEKTQDLYVLIAIEPALALSTTQKHLQHFLGREKELFEQIKENKALEIINIEIQKEMNQASQLK